MSVPLMLTFVSMVVFAIQLLIFVYLYSSHRVRFFRYLLLAWGAFTLSKGLKLVDVFLLHLQRPSFATDLTSVAAVGFTLAAAMAHRWDYRLRGRGLAIGAAAVAQSAPDGYTLLLGTGSTHGTNASVYSKLTYDPVRDFVPVVQTSALPFVLVVPTSLPVKTVADLIALARSKPGELSFGTWGNGSINHLAAELFNSMAKIQANHIPYRGSAPVMTDLNASGGIDGVLLPFVDGDARFADEFSSLDLRLQRPFHLGSGLVLVPMVEVFNLFDTTNILGSGNRNYSGYRNALVRDSENPADPGYLHSSTFGKAVTTAGGVLGSGGPRAVQLGLRLEF